MIPPGGIVTTSPATGTPPAGLDSVIQLAASLQFLEVPSQAPGTTTTGTIHHSAFFSRQTIVLVNRDLLDFELMTKLISFVYMLQLLKPVTQAASYESGLTRVPGACVTLPAIKSIASYFSLNAKLNTTL